MNELRATGVVQVRTAPTVSPRWKGTNTKGGPVVTKRSRKPRWTQATAITALQEWAELNDGRAPRQHELVRAIPPLPSNAVLQKMFGGLRGAAIAADLPPTPFGRGGRHDRGKNGTQPAPEVQEVEVETPLARLSREIQEAEVVLNELRPAFVDARDRVVLLRMELIELLTNMNEEDA